MIYYFHGYGLNNYDIIKSSKEKNTHILDDLEYKLIEFPKDFFNQRIFDMISYINDIIDEPSYLIGHSLMGLVVFLFSQFHKEKVTKLILIDPLTPSSFFKHKINNLISRTSESSYSKECYMKWLENYDKIRD